MAARASAAAARYNLPMTTRTDYRADTARESLARARTHLAEGDLLGASEQGWSAAARAVGAAAEARGLRHGSHRDLFRVVDRLVEETGDGEISDAFCLANSLHTNFHEGWLPRATVERQLAHVAELLAKLDELAARSGPDVTTLTDYHSGAAREFLARARAYVAEGDLLRASEQGWCAAARAVADTAEARGWPHDGHHDLFRAVAGLVKETGDKGLHSEFGAALLLHTNFHEDWLGRGYVEANLAAVAEFVAKLEALAA